MFTITGPGCVPYKLPTGLHGELRHQRARRIRHVQDRRALPVKLVSDLDAHVVREHCAPGEHFGVDGVGGRGRADKDGGGDQCEACDEGDDQAEARDGGARRLRADTGHGEHWMRSPFGSGKDRPGAVPARKRGTRSAGRRRDERRDPRRLWISPATVKKHLENVYGKLEVGRRTAALARTGRSLAAGEATEQPPQLN
ncbi:MAG: hypothetical protein KY392_06805 [Chloroflexi bacterium]|nr:hypothetical protein [Chloroflexota bacterium]